MKKGKKKGSKKVNTRKGSDKKFWRGLQIVLSVLIVLLLVFVAWANFFYFKDCQTQECFNDYLSRCRRAEFVRVGDATMKYNIMGRVGDECKVDVEVVRSDLGVRDSNKIVGKEMACMLPYGVVMSPEADLDLCSGDLKEGLQDLFISKLHRYIVQNIGEINEDLLSV